MATIRTFTVTAKLPERLLALQKIAQNLWWTWNASALELFRRIDDDLWEQTYHNPVKMLGCVSAERLKLLLHDDAFLAHLDRVSEALDAYLAGRTWFQETYEGKDAAECNIAYFSAEFGITESIRTYAGGMGLLAGEHLKSASDLGLPLVGVGLAYRQGYFRQYLNVDGWQQETYPENDFFTLPFHLMRDESGALMQISVAYPHGEVRAQIWRLKVGRIDLYLLDTHVEGNTAQDQAITFQLYGGNEEMRIRQEIMLGIGGVRVLRKMGIQPSVFHMNEGHSAFLGLERIREQIAEDGLSFSEARETVAPGLVFTTHTPVAAGNDAFESGLVDRYFSAYSRELGIEHQSLLALGRRNSGDENERFSMTVLALRLAEHANAVSKLHSEVSRRMWRGIWPELPDNEIPITPITNGIHTRSWISGEMQTLYDRYLGLGWVNDSTVHSVWARVDRIPDGELWRTHERRRERLVAFCRHRLREQLQRRGVTRNEIDRAREVLDPDALTIGFARRFATYKRAALIFRDAERLDRILNASDRPIQIIFAGKAHPRDHEGKELIKYIIHMARQEPFRDRVVFIEDYDINVARYMVQGVDVWLNTPRRPLEASGTSGMKVPPNGGLNLSVLDGWWCEGYNQNNGWAIGLGETYADLNYQDEVESRALYDLLEKEIVPEFYRRGKDGLPRGWIARMKDGIRTLCPQFNTHRMVREYLERFYLPARERASRLDAAAFKRARDLAGWRSRMEMAWPRLRVEDIKADETDERKVGDPFTARAWVFLGPLTPKDVRVQLYHGLLDTQDEISSGSVETMTLQRDDGEGRYLYEGELTCRTAGRHGYAVRVLPDHPDLSSRPQPGMIRWG